MVPPEVELAKMRHDDLKNQADLAEEKYKKLQKELREKELNGALGIPVKVPKHLRMEVENAEAIADKAAGVAKKAYSAFLRTQAELKEK